MSEKTVIALNALDGILAALSTDPNEAELLQAALRALDDLQSAAAKPTDVVDSMVHNRGNSFPDLRQTIRRQLTDNDRKYGPATQKQISTVRSWIAGVQKLKGL